MISLMKKNNIPISYTDRGGTPPPYFLIHKPHERYKRNHIRLWRDYR